jgi:hypothetical protein
MDRLHSSSPQGDPLLHIAPTLQQRKGAAPSSHSKQQSKEEAGSGRSPTAYTREAAPTPTTNTKEAAATTTNTKEAATTPTTNTKEATPTTNTKRPQTTIDHQGGPQLEERDQCLHLRNNR